MRQKRLGQIHKELAGLKDKAQQIRARFTIDIFSDPMANIDYNSRSRLRDAKLTLLLAQDTEYQQICQQISLLEAEREVFYDERYEETRAELRELESEDIE